MLERNLNFMLIDSEMPEKENIDNQDIDVSNSDDKNSELYDSANGL